MNAHVGIVVVRIDDLSVCAVESGFGNVPVVSVVIVFHYGITVRIHHPVSVHVQVADFCRIFLFPFILALDNGVTVPAVSSIPFFVDKNIANRPLPLIVLDLDPGSTRLIAVALSKTWNKHGYCQHEDKDESQQSFHGKITLRPYNGGMPWFFFETKGSPDRISDQGNGKLFCASIFQVQYLFPMITC